MENIIPVEQRLIIPSNEKAITLVKVNNPLNPMLDRESKLYPYFGESILDIKRKNFYDDIPVVTSLNGKVISENDLDKIFLKNGDYLVFYPSVLGGGGGNDMLRSIAFLAVSVIAMFAAPYLAGLIGAGGSMFAQGAIAMAINMVGGLLINALLPPTKPDEPASTKSTYGWQPKTTQQPGIPIPVSYGRIKSHGNILAAYNENVKYKSTANILIGFGLGPVEDISDYKINDQRQKLSKELKFYERHGEVHQPVIPNFNDTKTENPLDILLKYYEDYVGAVPVPLGYECKKADHTGQYFVFRSAWDTYEGVAPSLPDSSVGTPYVIGNSYGSGGFWICVDTVECLVTTAGDNFNALEVELYFPKGLSNFEDTGESNIRTIKYDIEISPTGQNDFKSICRHPKYGTVWNPKTEMPNDGIVVSPAYTNIYKVIDRGSATQTGSQEPVFHTNPWSVVVESTSSEYPIYHFEEVWYYNNTTWTSVDPKILSGDLISGPYELALNNTNKFLFCKIDSNDTSATIGFGLLTYVIQGGDGATLRGYYPKGASSTWTSLSTGDGFNTDETLTRRFMKGSKWVKGIGTVGGTQPSSTASGHWVRFEFAGTPTANPRIGLMIPAYKSTSAIVGKSLPHIVYADARKNFDGDYGVGVWSLGYNLPSGSLLGNDVSVWVELKSENINPNKDSKHSEGDKPDENDPLRKDAYWSRKSGEGYCIPISSMEGKRSISKANSRAFWLTTRSWDIFPKGYYDVRVTRLSKQAPDGSRYAVDECRLSNVREIVYDDFSYPRQALVGVKALATEKLSGSFDFSAVITGKVVRVYRPDEVIGPSDGLNYRCISNHTSGTFATDLAANRWEQGGSSAVENGIAWATNVDYSSSYKWVHEYSTNPAWVCYDLLSQPVLGVPSMVYGSDGTYYECVISHTAASTNIPVTGRNYSLYWQNGGDVYGYATNTAVGKSYIARPVHREEGIESTRIDTTSFKNWADYCDELVYDETGGLERRHEFNGIFDNEESLWEAALKVCEMSRASLIWNGTTLAAVMDKEIALPGDAVQLFTMGNIVPDSFQENFLPMDERIGEIEVNFLNRNKDWEKDTVSIFNPTYLRPSNKTSVDPVGITKSSQAWRHARYLINCNKELKKTIQFETDIEAIACTIGDVFYFQNDTPRWGMAGGRIESFTTPTTIRLDQTITMSASSSYGLMLRTQDDTVITKSLNSYTGTFQTVTATSTFSKTPNPYDVYAIGLSGSEAKAFRVVNISQTADHKAKITGIEYSANVFTDDAVSPHVDDTEWPGELEPIIPVYDLTLRELPSNLTGEKRDIEISFSIPATCIKYKFARVWYTYTPASRSDLSFSDWVLLKETTGNKVILPNASVGYRYDIHVISVNDEGVETHWEDSPTASIVVSGLNFSPRQADSTRITGLQIIGNPNSTTFTGRDCKIGWNPIITIFPNMVAGQDAAVSQPTAFGTSFNTTTSSTTVDYTGTALEDVVKSSYAAGAGTALPQTWFKDYEVKVYNSGVLVRTEHVVDPFYNYSYEKNYEDSSGSPTRSFDIEVAARDTSLKRTGVAVISCYNPPPSAPTFTSKDTRTGFEIEIDPILEPDIAGYKVWYAQTETNFSATATVISDGMGTKISHECGIGKVYVQLQSYDVFGATE